VATGITKVFIKGTKYDANRLLTLFADVKIPKVALGRILAQRKDYLQVRSLIALLGTADRDGRAVLVRLIERAATEAVLPDLIRATRHDDPTIRLSMVRLLARFSTEAVRETLSGLLNDPHKDVRQAALEGLASLKIPLEAGSICQMLRDPDPAIQMKSKEILVQLRDSQTLHALINLLQDDAEEVRQRAVDVLNAMQDSTPVRALLIALKDKEWWVKMRAFDALRTAGEAKLLDAVFTLLQDEDEYLRSSAVEILKQEERAFDYLVETLDNPDMEARARAVGALVTLEDKRAVPVFLRMLHDTPEVGALVIPALTKLGDRQAIPALVECLQGTDPAARKEALRTLATLTDAAHAEQVLKAVMVLRDTADAELKEAANGTASALLSKFGAAAMGKSTQVTNASAMIMQRQSVLRDLHSTEAPRPPEPDLPDLTATVINDRDTEGYIDAETLEPEEMLVERYRVIRRVGKGGFGSVILVEDTAIGEEIILKFLNREVASDESMIRRFKHELLYARRITHENVIRIHDFLILGKSYAISMEYFLSHGLDEELQPGALNIKRGLKIIWDICCGMSAAHQVGVVHRDLKPQNVLINDHNLVKVVDFGLAAVDSPEARLTKTGILMGTPLYIAPEQIRARTIDARTDIYSLGVIMYEVFTGRPPYMADDPMAILFQHVEGNPTPPRQLRPDLPAGLEAIILKAMGVDPAKRFQTMDDLRRGIVALTKQELR
jgi:serine/threonine-protein kinase